MKRNMGNADRMIRLIIAFAIAVLYFTGTLSGSLGLVLFILAVVFAITSFISICPIYTLFGISSCQTKKSH